MTNGKLKKNDFPDLWADNFVPAITDKKCPKCGSRTLSIIEFITASTTFNVVVGRLNRAAGIHEFGEYGRYNVRGECGECDHRWAMKNARQITDVVTELNPETFEPL